MNVLAHQLIARHRGKLIFIVFWLHVSLLNTINVSSRGPLFLWHESGQLFTLVVNFAVALGAFSFYLIIIKLFSLCKAARLARVMN